jgi:signal peptidase I
LSDWAGVTKRTQFIVSGWLAVLLLACSGSSTPKTRFDIVSPAMDPTIREHESVRVYEGNYQPHRGDVVLFDAPPEERTASISTLVKRVVGLPGETIEARSGRVYVNGHPLREPYLPSGTQTGDLTRQVVPAGSYFVLGDNRAASSDSRVFGPIPQSSITGRVCTCDLHA